MRSASSYSSVEFISSNWILYQYFNWMKRSRVFIRHHVLHNLKLSIIQRWDITCILMYGNNVAYEYGYEYWAAKSVPVKLYRTTSNFREKLFQF